ncbi:MAG: FHA domain-containing protein [Verrucomicrobiota bacterium]|jgi:pSer/pThr/pTyr-binding forkhead associated (FHA) protein
MAKLVILTQGMTDRAHELKVDRTTIGRVEDNLFQIAEPSVSSHHCEVLLRGNDVVIKDLDSTNGTFINGEKIAERVLQPGQTLRLGNVELRLDTGAPPAAGTPVSAPASAPAPTGAPAKKTPDGTMVIPRGVSLGELEKGGGRPAGFDTNKQFSKKSNKVNHIFLIIGVVAALLIIILILYAFTLTGNGHK